MAWSNRQKAIVKKYQRYAGMPDQEYRALLHRYTGATSSTHRILSQLAFDTFMTIIEVPAHLAFVNGVGHGKTPASNWYYWRNRAPKSGHANTRLQWEIDELWEQLIAFLEPSKQCEQYRLGIASKAVGHDVSHLGDLLTLEAHQVIEALKDLLKYARRKAS